MVGLNLNSEETDIIQFSKMVNGKYLTELMNDDNNDCVNTLLRAAEELGLVKVMFCEQTLNCYCLCQI